MEELSPPRGRTPAVPPTESPGLPASHFKDLFPGSPLSPPGSQASQASQASQYSEMELLAGEAMANLTPSPMRAQTEGDWARALRSHPRVTPLEDYAFEVKKSKIKDMPEPGRGLFARLPHIAAGDVLRYNVTDFCLISPDHGDAEEDATYRVKAGIQAYRSQAECTIADAVLPQGPSQALMPFIVRCPDGSLREARVAPTIRSTSMKLELKTDEADTQYLLISEWHNDAHEHMLVTPIRSEQGASGVTESEIELSEFLAVMPEVSQMLHAPEGAFRLHAKDMRGYADELVEVKLRDDVCVRFLNRADVDGDMARAIQFTTTRGEPLFPVENAIDVRTLQLQAGRYDRGFFDCPPRIFEVSTTAEPIAIMQHDCTAEMANDPTIHPDLFRATKYHPQHAAIQKFRAQNKPKVNSSLITELIITATASGLVAEPVGIFLRMDRDLRMGEEVYVDYGDEFKREALTERKYEKLILKLREHLPDVTPEEIDALLESIRNNPWFADALATGTIRDCVDQCSDPGDATKRVIKKFGLPTVWKPPPSDGKAPVVEQYRVREGAGFRVASARSPEKWAEVACKWIWARRGSAGPSSSSQGSSIAGPSSSSQTLCQQRASEVAPPANRKKAVKRQGAAAADRPEPPKLPKATGGERGGTRSDRRGAVALDALVQNSPALQLLTGKLSIPSFLEAHASATAAPEFDFLRKIMDHTGDANDFTIDVEFYGQPCRGARVEIWQTESKGLGVRAVRQIESGSPIMLYVGNLQDSVTDVENNRHTISLGIGASGMAINGKPNDAYAFEYLSGAGSIINTMTEGTTETPNTAFRNIPLPSLSKKNKAEAALQMDLKVVVALKNIEIGEELIAKYCPWQTRGVKIAALETSPASARSPASAT